jgi:hypothetical protein
MTANFKVGGLLLSRQQQINQGNAVVVDAIPAPVERLFAVMGPVFETQVCGVELFRSISDRSDENIFSVILHDAWLLLEEQRGNCDSHPICLYGDPTSL